MISSCQKLLRRKVLTGWSNLLPSRSRFKDGLPGLRREELDEMLQQIERAEDEFTYEQQLMPLKIREAEKLKQRVKYKIIERKHFKKPQEPNLLTYDAKEQMRYLHQEFPDEWTVDKLSESFPISKEGAIKVLKAKWRPRSMAELKRHDSTVRKNWLQLTSGEKEALGTGGPLEDRYQKLLESGRLLNADGIPSLPSPEGTLYLPEEEKISDVINTLFPPADGKNPSLDKRRKFIDIFAIKFKDDTKEIDSPGNVNQKQTLLDFKKENSDALMEIVQQLPVPQNKDAKAVMPSYSPHVNEKTRQFAYRERPIEELNEHMEVPSSKTLFDVHVETDIKNSRIRRGQEWKSPEEATAILDGDLLEFPTNPDDEANEKFQLQTRGRRSRRQASHSVVTQKNMFGKTFENAEKFGDYCPEHFDSLGDWDEATYRYLRGQDNATSQKEEKVGNFDHADDENVYKQLQMEGTGIISKKGTKLEQFVEQNYDYNSATNEKYYIDPEKERFLETLQYDNSPEDGAYAYAPDTGYQHPYGKTDQSMKIDVPKSENPHRRYQKGNAIYDENGDLLFRLPK